MIFFNGSNQVNSGSKLAVIELSSCDCNNLAVIVII